MAFGVKTNERPGTRAELKYARFSAYKAREVLNLIRGKSIAEAQAILQLTERSASVPILKTLNSAVANAEHNDNIAADELYVSACFSDEGPTLKRFRPRARGRAGRINKRTCHVTVIVSRYAEADLEMQRAKQSRRGAAPGAAASRARRVSGSRKSGETTTPLADEVPTDEVVTDEIVTDEIATGDAVTGEVVEADIVDEAPADEAPTDEVVTDADATDEAAEGDK